MKMRPAVGSWKPAIMRRVVVLPQPDGPSSVSSSPGRTSRRDVVHGSDLALHAVLELRGNAVEADGERAHGLMVPIEARGALT